MGLAGTAGGSVQTHSLCLPWAIPATCCPSLHHLMHKLLKPEVAGDGVGVLCLLWLGDVTWSL